MYQLGIDFGIQQNNEEIQPQQELLFDFYDLIKQKLYLTNIQAAKTKNDLEYYCKPIDIDVALHDYSFLRYGTKKATSFIIIDIDYCKKSLENFAKEINRILPTPTWITQTTRGFHVAYVLDKPVFLGDNQKTSDVMKLEAITKTLSSLLDGDEYGSFKKIGFYRNPLTHNSIINTATYDINKLNKMVHEHFFSSFSLFDTPQEINSKINLKNRKESLSRINWSNVKHKGFVEGNRNNYLFKTVLGLRYKNTIKKEEVLSTLMDINRNSLGLEELKRIEKSIHKYTAHINGPIIKKENKGYVKGDYWNSLSDYGIHNYKKDYKIEYSRQKIGQKIRTAKVIANTTLKLVEAYKKIYQSSSKKFTNENILNNSDVSKRTIQRYRNDRKLEIKIKNTAFAIYIRDLNTGGDGVKANDTLLLEMINSAIKTVKFIYKNGNNIKRVFSFIIKNDFKVCFLEI